MRTSTHAPSLHIHKDCPHTAYNHPSGGDPILLAQDVATGNASLERAAECYNACAGIPDPKAALQKARDEFSRLIRLVEPFLEAGNSIPGLATMNGAKLALSLLTYTKPEKPHKLSDREWSALPGGERETNS